MNENLVYDIHDLLLIYDLLTLINFKIYDLILIYRFHFDLST